MQQLLMGGSESSNRLFASPSELEQAAGLCREDVVCGVSGGAGKKKRNIQIQVCRSWNLLQKSCWPTCWFCFRHCHWIIKCALHLCLYDLVES